ncbi:type II secretion system protein [bacterium]|nr:type II secretion system protein [bacterium]
MTCIENKSERSGLYSNSALNATDTLPCHCEGSKNPSQSYDLVNQKQSLTRMNKIFTPTSRLAMTRKKCAFTLAEVLITLGIIGIVAALTIPTLMQQQRKIATQTALKKFSSTMQNAIKLSEVENGTVDKWTKISGENGEVATDYFLNYLAPYLKYTQLDSSTNRPTIYFADGSILQLWNGNCMDLIYDTNGEKGPNQYGIDLYTFMLCSNSSFNERYCESKDRAFCPLYSDNRGKSLTYTREERLAQCIATPSFCAKLLEYDNWEFKDDYPYSF